MTIILIFAQRYFIVVQHSILLRFQSVFKNSMLVMLIFLSVFLFIFGPPLMSVGRWFDISFFCAMYFSLGIVFSRRASIPQYINKYFLLFLPFIFSAAYAAVESYSVSEIASLLLKPVRIVITVVGAFGLVFWIFKIYGINAIRLILNCIFASIVLHSLIMILQFKYPEFKDFIYGIITIGEYRSYFGYDFRMGGLSGSTGGSVLSTVQSLGVILYPFLVKYNSHRRLIYLVGAIVCAFSVALCGRSGLIMIALFFPIAIVISGGNLKGSLKGFAALALFGLVAFGVLVNAGIELSYELGKSFARSFSFFMEFNQKGITGDDTFLYLKSGLLMPETFVSFFFGDPEALLNTQFEREVHSDTGYVRNLFGLGFLGMFLYLLPLILTMLNGYRQRKSHLIFYILSMFCLIMLVLHAKETVVYVRMFFPMISILMASGYVHRNSAVLFPKSGY